MTHICLKAVKYGLKLVWGWGLGGALGREGYWHYTS